MSASDDSKTRRRRKFRDEIAAEELRHLRGKRSRGELWFGLGMMGLVGWSVAVPTVAGVGLGIWLDARFGGSISWTITGLFVGVVLGSSSAWYWVSHEQKEANSDDQSDSR